MCYTDFSCELGEAEGGNSIYASENDLRKHRKCVDSGEKWCSPTEVVTMSKEDFLELVEKGIDPASIFQYSRGCGPSSPLGGGTGQ
jgi:hypothetical protein